MPSITPKKPTVSPEQALLRSMGTDLVSKCPDMREMAREIALKILHDHHLDALDPDAVYWHRFDRSQSSPLTFNGWQHLDRPVESMTLPQLVMHRFNANDQDNVDNLQMTSGFYSSGLDAERFDETNEVRLLPQDVLAVFWDLNFKAHVNERIAAFWASSSDDFRTLAKANFLGKAIEERHSGGLNAEAFNALIAALGIHPALPVDLALLQAETPSPDTVRITTLDIAGYEASDILCIIESSGRQFLYVPGEVDALQVFDTPDELQWWLMVHTNHTDNRTRFMSHFPLSTHSEGDHGVGLHHALDLLFSNWGPDTRTVINQKNHTISGDPFTWLRDASKTRMEADAHFALHSNGELRKEMWMGYLRAFGQVFGSLAALDWPVALAVVGAGMADVGLNIDQAVNGRTTAERKNGVTGAILGSIDVLFNGLFLLHAPTGDLGEVGSEAGSTVPEATPEPEPPFTDPDASVVELPPVGKPYPDDRIELLSPFETNELLDTYPTPASEGRMKGIYLGERGETYIDIDGIAYRVRYINEMNTWAIIDPENPFSFHRNIPVRLTDTGEWAPLSRQGLRGGGKWLKKWPWKTSTVDPVPPLAPTPYDLPENLRETLRSIMESPNKRPFQGYFNIAAERENVAMIDFFKIRDNLWADTQAFYADPELPARPSIPDIAMDAPPKAALKQLFESAPGIVIGESHSAVTSKRFLIDNMRLLVKQNVKTLYLEHLFTDLHQADLDLFARTGEMPETLESRLSALDVGHMTDPTGTYTFLNLVKTANEHHIRIKAIDCMSSYRVTGLAEPEQITRIKTMNYFARGVIAADQAGPAAGRWIALVGNAHANTFKGVAGVAEIEGVIGIRMADVAPGETTGFDPDPGEIAYNSLGKPAGEVKSDLRLRMAVEGKEPSEPATPTSSPQPQKPGTSVEARLRFPGTFIIERKGALSELVHRARDNTIVYTPIQFEGERLYIERPNSKWAKVSGRRFDSFEALAAALKIMGLRQV